MEQGIVTLDDKDNVGVAVRELHAGGQSRRGGAHSGLCG